MDNIKPVKSMYSTPQEMFPVWDGSEKFIQDKATSESQRRGPVDILGGGNGNVTPDEGSISCSRNVSRARMIKGIMG